MRFPRALILLAAPVLLLVACATPTDPGGGDVVSGGPGPLDTIAAPGEVLGQGTVLQIDGEDAQFCLGAVMESYPPQCSGPVIVSWEWPDDGMFESASGVTWGTYALTGTWDGVEFTPTQPPIPLALYDPMMQEPDPRTDPSNAGDNSDDQLALVQDELSAWTDVTVLTSYSENGYLWATVYYDDGTIQSYLDEIYGPDVVIVQSALRDIT
ncbi:hypothetical protein [Pseudolysinimonas sp.]|uniref:hypothetical protein n=1 Tax=Pseudolysinimonas sp. TaxID=2680009 RepID=UPI00286CC40B|nr:hypothetical protein [Pseudolysinimonas sp.]